MKTIAIDFDGVIHKYSRGWADGTIYDEANNDILKLMSQLMDEGYAVYILSTRSPWQIARWINKQYPWFGDMAYDLEYDRYFDRGGREVKVVPFWKKFWDTNKYLGVTRRKLPAIAYIDDRAIRFTGDINKLVEDLEKF